ncbi:hypothetical protein [Trueperella bialowiezensis]|uniref:DUF3017 domain-containing protein n=1 Tax=Trueperella bialowiezensis TaxID=312285 RepID=A0A3S4VF46_9ACTO|nr:hypothetical protein [Trueperella bialowiezensis]VEI12767.1 Uncharacterised protein [Trueperella bialowiezensis]
MDSDSRSPNKFPPAGVYALGLLWLAVIVALAFAVDVKTAAYVLGGSLIAYAAARAILPTGAIPRVRSKIHDAGIALVFAALLFALGSWGNALPV